MKPMALTSVGWQVWQFTISGKKYEIHGGLESAIELAMKIDIDKELTMDEKLKINPLLEQPVKIPVDASFSADPLVSHEKPESSSTGRTTPGIDTHIERMSLASRLIVNRPSKGGLG